MVTSVLIVDDEAAIRFGIRQFLAGRGYEATEAATCDEALEAFRAHRPDVVVLDYQLPDGTALDLLPRLRALDADVPVAILSAHGSIELAVEAIKLGAEQFLTKPVELPALEIVLQRMLENQRNRLSQLAAKARESRTAMDPFLGTSREIRALADEAKRIARADGPVLIRGETGSGKGVLARWLHGNGPRAAEPFVDLNCAGLSREFLETELFGHERGAFTGAVAAKAGLLELAHRGTAFLDEIGDVDLQVQPKLLKVLEEKRFHRLGGVRDRTVDLRLISATHVDLERAAAEGRFRRDLYFRLATFPLAIPPLRERREDIEPLARWLLRAIGARVGHPEIDVAPGACRALAAYAWPGNVRELRNVLERAALLCDRPTLEAADLGLGLGPAAAPAPAPAPPTSLTLAEVERQHIERVLEEEGGNVQRAAVRLGVPRSTLYQRLKLLGLTVSRS